MLARVLRGWLGVSEPLPCSACGGPTVERRQIVPSPGRYYYRRTCRRCGRVDLERTSSAWERTGRLEGANGLHEGANADRVLPAAPWIPAGSPTTPREALVGYVVEIRTPEPRWLSSLRVGGEVGGSAFVVELADRLRLACVFSQAGAARAVRVLEAVGYDYPVAARPLDAYRVAKR